MRSSVVIFLLSIMLLVAIVSAQPSVDIEFVANATSGPPPLPVMFTDVSTVQINVTYRNWDFGDGSSFQSLNPQVQHTYITPGRFTVRMERYDDQGYHTRIKYDYITVTEITPTATPTPTSSPTTVPTTTIPTTSPTSTATTSLPEIPPMEFWGTVSIQGSPAPVGSQIIARISGNQRGSITTSVPGQYGGGGPFDQRLRVYAQQTDFQTGTPQITFWLGPLQADQTVPFSSGTSVQQSLTFSGPVPTTIPTIPPTFTPTVTPTTTVPTTTPTTTTTPLPPPDLSLYVYHGWNFIAIPGLPISGHDTGDIFRTVDTAGHSMWRYNGSIQLWESMNRSDKLNPLDAFWIYSEGTVEIPLYINKSQTHFEKYLYKDWNGFGIPGSSERQAREALAPLGQSWSRAIGFNPFTQLYDSSIINGGTGEHSDMRPMYPKQGYWLFLVDNATYQVNGIIIS